MQQKKENWFFLRGLTRGAGHWGEFLARFRASFPEYDVHCIDLPGNETHFRQLSPLSISKMLESVRRDFRQILAVQELTGQKRPNNLFSVSLGGMVSIQWMQQFPEEITSAVLINSSLRTFSPFYHRFMPRNYPNVVRMLVMRDLERRERLLLEMTSNRPELHERLAKDWANIQKQRPVSKQNFFRQIFAASRFAPKKEPPKHPLLILNGLGDHLVHPSCSEKIAKAWNTEFAQHLWAGHDLTLDDPDWVIKQFANWRNGQNNQQNKKRQEDSEEHLLPASHAL